MSNENEASAFRQQHGSRELVCDIAYREGIIDDCEHKDCMFLLQMREAFSSRTCPRDSMLGRMVDDKAMTSDTGTGSSLAEKYFTYLREADSTTQLVMGALISESQTSKKLWSARKMIKDAVKAFAEWCQK